jgi:hypothetical protein
VDQRSHLRQDGRADGAGYGTMVSFDGSQYVDSCACLSGFGPDHEVTCAIANSGAVGGLEVEILLRADITSDHVFLYELDCVYAEGGIDLVRWDMTKANPNSYTFLRKRHTVLRKLLGGEVPFSDGDQAYAKIVGTVVTCRYKLAGRGAFSRGGIPPSHKCGRAASRSAQPVRAMGHASPEREPAMGRVCSVVHKR